MFHGCSPGGVWETIWCPILSHIYRPKFKKIARWFRPTFVFALQRCRNPMMLQAASKSCRHCCWWQDWLIDWLVKVLNVWKNQMFFLSQVLGAIPIKCIEVDVGNENQTDQKSQASHTASKSKRFVYRVLTCARCHCFSDPSPITLLDTPRDHKENHNDLKFNDVWFLNSIRF